MSRIIRIVAGVALAVWSLPSSGSVTAPAPAPPESWSQTALARIAAQEYRFSWHDGVLSAPNRAHDLRARVSASGFSIVSRVKGEDAFRLGLQLARVGRGRSVVEAGPALVVETNGRAELRRTEMTEWLKNGPDGVEHGVTLARPPVRGEAPLVLVFTLGGNVLAYPEGNDGRSLLFRDGHGDPVIRYGGLAVVDARGTDLPARMIAGPGELRIEIDDDHAVYPVTVDPLATSPQWTASVAQVVAHFGASVCTAGDVNGDGYSDVLVAAVDYDEGEANEGKVFLYLGSASGLAASPAWTAQSNQALANFGFACAAGDFNNDGKDDVLVGDPFYNSDTGAAFLWFGGTPGGGNPSGLGADGTPANADWAVFGIFNENLGYSVARAGDVRGLGFNEVLVGVPGYFNERSGDGAAFMYFGSGSGPSTTPDWVGTVSGMADPGTRYGTSVAGAGDVNGDGYDDVVVGAPNWTDSFNQEGAVFYYRGSGSGPLSSPVPIREGQQSGANLGRSIAGVGDVNGDGYADFVAGAPSSDDGGRVDNGKVLVWLGRNTTPLQSGGYASTQNGANLGVSVAAAGDVNGDGLADFVAGSDLYNATAVDDGRAWLFMGRSGSPVTTPSWTVDGGQSGAHFGASVSGAGDVNGDGYADVVVGSPLWNETGSDNGQARLFLGGPLGLNVSAETSLTPGQDGADFGTSVAGAGDLNADGYSDVIVGAPRYDNGEADEGAAFVYLGGPGGLTTSPAATIEGNQVGAGMGTSVAGAGDFDGDGRCDVIVGAPASNSGGSLSGVAWVYRGGPTGLTGERWSVGPVQAQAQMGHSVAGAGDVNGDGFADVVVGAYHWNRTTTDEGAAFVILGSSSGPAGTIRIGPSLGSTSAHMGDVVAGAGDVNRDGKSDVIVGMPEWDGFSGGQQGKVYLFMGSDFGIDTSPTSWSPEGTVFQQYLGSSVASAGDVNGDGFADVIVGEQGWSNNQTNEGRALVYLGPLDQFSGPSWTFESDQQLADLGRGPTSVASAGDVNNDGYSDVIVGATDWDQPSDDGKAWLFLGSGSGLTSTPAWSAVGGNGASFGFSLAPAGDVNGDGYSDVIVGEYRFGINAGKAHIFYGNGGLGGRPHTSLQWRQTHVIAPLGMTDSDRVMTVNHASAMPAGYDEGRMELEVKPLTVPFDGAGTTLGSKRFSRGSLEDFTVNPPLGPVTPFHWRIRAVGFRNPYFPRSPWFGLADTSRTLTDFRTGCFASRWYQDNDGDGHGNPAVFVDSCFIIIGSVLTSDDCDDTNPARYPGNPEICDGIDNNCDALVDNAAAPSGSNQMTAAKSGLTAILSWSAVSGATSYDIVRGSLATLRGFGGNYTVAVTGCLGNNTAGPTVSDTSVPPPGDAAWYLIRGVNCGGNGSYDEGVATQSGSRDAEIAASSSACP